MEHSYSEIIGLGIALGTIKAALVVAVFYIRNLKNKKS